MTESETSQSPPITELMPFCDANLEEEFQTFFHTRRKIIDSFWALSSIWLVSEALAIAEEKELWQGWPQVIICLAAINAIASGCLPGVDLTKWRYKCMMAMKCIVLVVSIKGMQEMDSKHEAPTFSSAALLGGLHCARCKLPLILFLLWTLPLRGHAMTLHASVVMLLCARSRAECQSLVDVNGDFRRFAAQLEEVHGLWRGGPPGAACIQLCEYLDGPRNIFPPPVCLEVCRPLLPVVWWVYGEPWLKACICHRTLMIHLVGFAFPIGVLYLGEMRDRWQFAQKKLLTTAPFATCLSCNAWPVCREALMKLGAVWLIYIG
eukprot:jgi/Botrbrau1/9245/Bobra.180_1s0006.1